MSKKDSNLTQARLKELLRYDAQSGLFAWKVKRPSAGGFVSPGDIAGYKNPVTGYTQIRIDGEIFQAHRLAFLYVTGAFPKHVTDHRDTNRANNRWDNIRDVTQSVNMQNKKIAQRNSSHGFLGIYLRKPSNVWVARVHTDGKSVWVGSFSTPEEAHAAYVAAKRRLHPGGTI
jgi:hypothetical protein